MLQNAINWFEIPSEDFDRARKFYESLLQTELQSQDMGEFQMAFLPYEMGTGVGGAVVKSSNHKPGTEGSIVYLNGGDDLSHVLNRVEHAGGRVIMPKTQIGNNYGFMAMFRDTEGNHIGLHSMN